MNNPSVKSTLIKEKKQFDNSILLLFAVALVVRVFKLGSQSLWLDEAVIFTQISNNSFREVYNSIEGHIGPLYHLIQYAFSLIGGTSEWAMRFPAALYGAFSVVLVYSIGKQIIDKNSATIGSLIFIFSPLHIWYSQEARMYSLWILLVLLATFIFLRLRENNRLIDWMFFTIICSASVWTYLNSIYVFFALGIYLLVSIRKNASLILPFFLCMVIVAVSYSPGITAFLLKKEMGIGSVRPTGVFDLGFSFLGFSLGTSFGPALTEIRSLKAQFGNQAVVMLLKEHGIYLVPALIFMVSLFLYSLKKAFNNRKIEDTEFLLVMCLIPAGFIFLTAFFIKSIPFNVRYILCGLPFFALLLGYGIKHISAWRKIVVILVYTVITFYSLYNHYFVDQYQKVDMRSALGYLEQEMTENSEALIFYEHAPVVLNYYDKTGKLLSYYLPIHSTLEDIEKRLAKAKNLLVLRTVRVQEYSKDTLSHFDSCTKKHFKNLGCERFIKSNVCKYQKIQ